MNNTEVEYYTFGKENKLKVFSPNTFNFKPKEHIFVDEIQQCLLDNLWYQYNNKKEDKGYFLAILNSLSEYFNEINGMLPSSDTPERFQIKPLYVIYNGGRPGIYTSFENIVILKKEMQRRKDTASFARYMDVDEALSSARRAIGPNYYIEPSAREYIQNYRLVQNNNKTPEEPNIVKIKESSAITIKEEENTSKKLTYAESLKKEGNHSNGEYIEYKIEEKLGKISSAWKEDIKKEVLKEVKKEMNRKFEEMKKAYEDKFKEMKKEYDEKFEEAKKVYDDKFVNTFLDEDLMDIGGHGQPPESDQN